MSLFLFNSCVPIFATSDNFVTSDNEDSFEKVSNALVSMTRSTTDQIRKLEEALEEKPDEGDQTLDEDESTPDEDEQTLDEDESTPDEGEQTPDEDEQTPDEGEPTPDEDEQTPDEDEQNELDGEERPERVAFLTFDDGPSANTLRILDILSDEDVPAIFFLQGSSILNNYPTAESTMERILSEGHYIGLHTMTHEYYNLYVGAEAPSRFVAEKLELQELIYDLTGHHTYLCRAAYGMMSGFSPEHHVAVDEAGINCIDWNIDPKDWVNNARGILEEVVEQVELYNFPSEVMIVLHEYNHTVQALPQIIEFLREHGYVFKTYVPGYEFIYYRYQ